MKKFTILLLFGLVIAFASCTTAYKSGQTPDDVYSSPAPPQDENMAKVRPNERQYRYYNEDEYDEYEDYDDRYLRMKVRNRQRWSDLDDWYYYGDRYNYSYYNNLWYWNDPFYWNDPWSPVSYWNTFYNPYWGYYGWGMGFGYRWGGGWYGSYAWNPWYGGGWGNPWGFYGYGGYGYGSLWDPYFYYGPGAVIVGRAPAYGARTTNLNTYNRSGIVPSNTSRTGYANNSYGTRNDVSVSTNQFNATAGGRAQVIRERSDYNYNSGNRNTQNYNRSNNYQVNPNSRMNNNGYSQPSISSESRSSNISSGGVSSGSGGRSGSSGGASGRRF